MKGEIGTQTRKDSGASFITDGGGPVLSARVAEERNHVLGQELAEEEARLHADPVRKAKERGLDAWGQFNVFGRPNQGRRGHVLGVDRERGGRRGGGESSLRSGGLSGPRSSTRQCGHRGMCEPEIAPLATDIPVAH